MAVSIVLSIWFGWIRSKYMTIVGQEIIYDIRKDLFDHLQKLPFQFYDDRPHGKILTRVINYVNNVSDALSNGIINFILETFNLILIAGFMLACDVRLSLIVMAGIPLFLIVVFFIKPAQRRAWQDVSNKGSNLNAYLHESLMGRRLPSLCAGRRECGDLRQTEPQIRKILDESAVYFKPCLVFCG